MRNSIKPPLAVSITLLAACVANRASREEPVGSETPQMPSVEASRDGGEKLAAPDASVPVTDDDTAQPESPTTPNVQLIGRFDTRDPAGPRCGWPGCRIVARFHGTAVSARFDEVVEDWMLGGPSEWDVAVDGIWQPKLVLSLGHRDYVLATALPLGDHTIELYKRSEAQNGTTQFLGFDFGGGTLLLPPPRKSRRLEIIGDSQPAAFGVEGVGYGTICPGLQYAAEWQNFHESFAARIGEKVGAEVLGTVYSGKGIVRDIWRPDDQTMPVCFPRALPVDPQSSWDFSKAVPHVVIIMMGGNDFAIGQPVDDGEPTVEQFTDGYDAFVGTIRQKYPKATIILSASPSADDRQPEGRNTRTNVIAGIHGVVTRRQGSGDAKVIEFHPSVAVPSELTGCESHGNPAFHERVANEYLPVLHTTLGW